MAARNREQLGEAPSVVEPLKITARLSEGIVFHYPIMLDGLLAYVYAIRARLLPPMSPEECVPIAVPIKRSECGTFSLVSEGHCEVEEHELRYKNRRVPWQEMARLGTSKIKRVQINFGVNKSYRVPYQVKHLRSNTITWWALGDGEKVAGRLSDIHYLGKHRGSGKGKLSPDNPWLVEECESWPGFPIMRDGAPLRPLPEDYPGLSDGPGLAMRCLSYPYWALENEVMCAVPE